MQLLASAVERWRKVRDSSKLSAYPQGQVDLDHVEEDQGDVGVILVCLVKAHRTEVLAQVISIPGTPMHLHT